MQKFNIIEIAAIVSKHDYLSIAISRIDEAYNPYINEYGIILHFNQSPYLLIQMCYCYLGLPLID